MDEKSQIRGHVETDRQLTRALVQMEIRFLPGRCRSFTATTNLLEKLLQALALAPSFSCGVDKH